METKEFAELTIDTLCEYAGEDAVFDALVRRWGIEQLFEIVSGLMDTRTKLMEGENEEENGA